MTSNEYGEALMNSLLRFRKTRLKNKLQFGLHPSEWHAMFMIKQLTEDSPGGVKVTELSKSLHVAPPTVTQKISSLQKKGLIHRVHGKTDRREVRISISAEGEKLIDTIHDDFLRKCIGLAEFLGDKDANKLNELLMKTSDYFLRIQDDEEQSKEC